VEQPVPEGLHPMEGTHAGAVREELQPVGKTPVGEVCAKIVSHERNFHAGAGDECEESSSPEEEGAAGTICVMD